MANVQISTICTGEKIRPMHAVNNGPTGKASYEGRGNFDTFKELKIPFTRNHDASLSEAYGSQHVVDVHCIFPDFDRDASDASAYDFAITDQYTVRIFEADSEVFYRLGASIEHWVTKYGTIKPKDFNKWVDICEHIIMHYNEGWADGFKLGIRYFEIWNEPDLDADDATNKRTWGGTTAEFYDLYEIAAKRLKARFPSLYIGGPALAYNEKWADAFLAEMKARSVPMDFFSWHVYTTKPKEMAKKAARIRALLEKNGYGDVPDILNEWNYVKKWEEPLHFLSVIKGLKGASFSVAAMCEMQTNSKTDMLMYYDARVEKIWNGLFDSDTLLPLKGYYAFKMYGELYKIGEYLPTLSDTEHIYACAARDGEKLAVLITSYSDDVNPPEEVTVNIDGIGDAVATPYYLDESRNFEAGEPLSLTDGRMTLMLPQYTSVLLVIG